MLGGYALSQQLPALLAPEPLLDSALALIRTGLMFGLLGVGAALGQARWRRLIGWGLGLVYLTALLYSFSGHLDLQVYRLAHPYMTSITLGLLGAIGIWTALFAGGRLLWRLPLGISALLMVLLSGSRGALAAALVGCLLGWLVGWSRQRGGRLALGLALGAVLLVGGVYLGGRLDLSSTNRLGSTDTSGRDVIWYSALSVIRSAPVAGVGSYRLGTRLAPPSGNCSLWPGPQGIAAPCPAWVSRLGQPWLIAHNISLQQLAETGPLGLAGLFMLLGVSLASALVQRDPLSVAILSGLLLASANDNTLLVPGPGLGEVFWVTAGMVLAGLPARSPAVGWAGGLAAAGLLILLSFPLLLGGPAPVKAELTTLIAPTTVSDPRNYQVYARLSLPPGRYRAVLRTCLRSCVPITTVRLQIPADGPAPLLKFGGDLYPAAQQRLELLLYPGQATLRPSPLAQTAWTVRRVP